MSKQTDHWSQENGEWYTSSFSAEAAAAGVDEEDERAFDLIALLDYQPGCNGNPIRCPQCGQPIDLARDFLECEMDSHEPGMEWADSIEAWIYQHPCGARLKIMNC